MGQKISNEIEQKMETKNFGWLRCFDYWMTLSWNRLHSWFFRSNYDDFGHFDLKKINIFNFNILVNVMLKIGKGGNKQGNKLAKVTQLHQEAIKMQARNNNWSEIQLISEKMTGWLLFP